jgi:hypothetical protein
MEYHCNKCKFIILHEWHECSECADFRLCTGCFATGTEQHHFGHTFCMKRLELSTEPISQKTDEQTKTCDKCSRQFQVGYNCQVCTSFCVCCECFVNAKDNHDPSHPFDTPIVPIVGLERGQEIPRISSPTLEEFQQKYYDPGLPVVIVDGCKDWPAVQKWTWQHLVDTRNDTISSHFFYFL